MASIAPRATRYVSSTSSRLASTTLRLVPLGCGVSRTALVPWCRVTAGYASVLRHFHSTPRYYEREPVKHSPKGMLPEFSLKDRVIIVSGGAQGLGLVQAEALLEAGAIGW